jgi:hypothetical protein
MEDSNYNLARETPCLSQRRTGAILRSMHLTGLARQVHDSA